MNNLYVALDGDNVGQRLEYYSFTNQLAELKVFSHAFSEKMKWLQEELIHRFEAEIIFCGGDNLMARLHLIFAQTERISIQFDIIHANRGRFYSEFEPKRPEQYLSKQIISSSGYGCEASNSIRLSCPDSK